MHLLHHPINLSLQLKAKAEPKSLGSKSEPCRFFTRCRQYEHGDWCYSVVLLQLHLLMSRLLFGFRFMREQVFAPEKIGGNVSIVVGVTFFAASIVATRQWGFLLLVPSA
ncbi:hypothetical protein FRC16_007366 [Serendipita sp. 398]|nr:hypothetical protein FRC16_007366 [Serendipita sp. 398]